MIGSVRGTVAYQAAEYCLIETEGGKKIETPQNPPYGGFLEHIGACEYAHVPVLEAKLHGKSVVEGVLMVGNDNHRRTLWRNVFASHHIYATVVYEVVTYPHIPSRHRAEYPRHDAPLLSNL